jgi:hypothetical protein
MYKHKQGREDAQFNSEEPPLISGLQNIVCRQRSRTSGDPKNEKQKTAGHNAGS